MTFGAYPLVGLGHTRQLHFEARKTLAAGIDPRVERRRKADAKRREAKEQQQEIGVLQFPVCIAANCQQFASKGFALRLSEYHWLCFAF